MGRSLSGRTGPTPARVFALTLLGTLLLQAVWILVVPPFRGMDEHDHAYRAADVARGDWNLHHPASASGYADYVRVPRDLVEAAQPICTWLPYTKWDNCRPAAVNADGTVEVASAASQYNPVFYFVIGSAARPFSGYAALYAMRAAAALMCALLLAWAAVVTRAWAVSHWPLTALVLAETPVLIYSASIASPNGVELCAAVLVWTSLVGLARTNGDRSATSRLLTSAAVGAIPLVTVRSMGPLWLLLMLLTVALVVPSADLRRVCRQGRTWVKAAIVGVATVAGAGWTVLAGTNSVAGATGHFDQSLVTLVPGQAAVWIFQSMGAFPARDEMAPLPVYALGLGAWWIFAAVGLRAATPRERWAALSVVLMSCLVPVLITVTTYHHVGAMWQGRYGYPYALGLWLLLGLVLDRRSSSSEHGRTGLILVLGVSGVIELVSQLHVLSRQRVQSPLAGTGAWLEPTAWQVVALVLLAMTALALAFLADPRRSRRGEPTLSTDSAHELETTAAR